MLRIQRQSASRAVATVSPEAVTRFLRQLDATRKALRRSVAVLDTGQPLEQWRETLAVMATAGNLAADIATLARQVRREQSSEHRSDSRQLADEG